MLNAKGISILLAIALSSSSFSEAAEFKAPALPKLIRKKSSTENLNVKVDAQTESPRQEELSFLEQHYASLVVAGVAVAASAFVFFILRGNRIVEERLTPKKAGTPRKSTGTPGSGSRIGKREMNNLLN